MMAGFVNAGKCGAGRNNKMANRKQQRGLTFVGLLVVAAALTLFGVVSVQVVYTYIEYTAVQRAVEKASAGETVIEVREIFNKAAAVENIRTISGKDLEVGKEGEKVVVSFAYQRDIHLVGPAYLVMRYKGRSK
jgi:Tfp pilus assembly major pilin PilA